jgi:hypothetical protein
MQMKRINRTTEKREETPEERKKRGGVGEGKKCRWRDFYFVDQPKKERSSCCSAKCWEFNRSRNLSLPSRPPPINVLRVLASPSQTGNESPSRRTWSLNLLHFPRPPPPSQPGQGSQASVDLVGHLSAFSSLSPCDPTIVPRMPSVRDDDARTSGIHFCWGNPSDRSS